MTPKKYPPNLHFSEKLKNIEIENFEPQNDPSLHMYENIEVPPPTPWGC